MVTVHGVVILSRIGSYLMRTLKFIENLIFCLPKNTGIFNLHQRLKKINMNECILYIRNSFIKILQMILAGTLTNALNKEQITIRIRIDVKGTLFKFML